jgi:hypothetical protein
LKVTFNSGYFARVDDNKGRKYCQELHEQIRAGQFAHDTIYVIDSQYWALLRTHLHKLVCGSVSQYIACISARNQDIFRDFLEQHTIEYPPNGGAWDVGGMLKTRQ